MNNAAIHSALGKLRRRQQFPSANNGQSFLGPHGALTAAADQQVFFCVRIALIAEDPNDNGGLDSNGYFRAYIEDSLRPALASNSPEVRVNGNPASISGEVYTQAALLTGGQRIFAYAYAQTIDSPDSDDDGFMLMQPIIGSQVAYGSCSVNQTITESGILNGSAINSPSGGLTAEQFQGMTYTDPNQIGVYQEGVYLATCWGTVASYQNPSSGWTNAFESITLTNIQDGDSDTNLGSQQLNIGAFAFPEWDVDSGLVTGGQWYRPLVPFFFQQPALFDAGDYLSVFAEYTGALNATVIGQYSLQYLMPPIPGV
jgi:hypothetical protein